MRSFQIQVGTSASSDFGPSRFNASLAAVRSGGFASFEDRGREVMETEDELGGESVDRTKPALSLCNNDVMLAKRGSSPRKRDVASETPPVQIT